MEIKTLRNTRYIYLYGYYKYVPNKLIIKVISYLN